jgi:hypothetical protein
LLFEAYVQMILDPAQQRLHLALDQCKIDTLDSSLSFYVQCMLIGHVQRIFLDLQLEIEVEHEVSNIDLKLTFLNLEKINKIIEYLTNRTVFVH